MENRALALMLWFLFVYFSFWHGIQNPVPNVWQIVFYNISVKGGVIHPNFKQEHWSVQSQSYMGQGSF